MAAAEDYGPVDGDEAFEALAQLISASFGIGPDAARQWLGPHLADARVSRRDGRVVGGLLLLPMGQYFGGRRVPVCGVAGVGVVPSERGRGAATRLMHDAVRELHESDAALSTLYPATFPLYRRAGYELAGGHYRIRVPAAAISVRDRELAVRSVERADKRAVERLYRRHAARRSGWLDRSDYVWRRVRKTPAGQPVYGHLVEGSQGPEGYVFYRHEPIPFQGGYDLVLSDLVSVSGRAARRLLGFLSDHRSQARDVIWHGGVDDPHVYLMPDRSPELTLVAPWMLRILDVPRALAARGYPRPLELRLDLDLEDPLLAANHGRFRVEISAGQAEVRPGGRATASLDIGALASLYSGHASPHQLAASGRLRASLAALAALAAAFAGPPPSLPDSF